MKKQTWLAIFRIALGALGLAAVVTQLITGIERGNNIGNFFSFFTIESNILAGILLVIIGIGMLMGVKKNIGFLRGATTLYMTMTGIIYALLLSNLDVSALQTTLPWVNIVLHYILPIVVLADWLIFPPASKVPFKNALWWLAYPLVYFAYSMIRGAMTQWYPYPFLNPVEKGWPSVIAVTLLITLATIVLTWLLTLRSSKEEAA